MRPLSYTQISRYQTCPLWYKLQYIDKLKPKERFYLSFGDVIHQCAEYFYKVPVPPPPSLEKLLRFYEANWISLGYESPEQEAQYKEYGNKLLADFQKIHSADFRMPLAVEHQFFLNINGIVLGGKIDRIDKLDNGVAIIDYKTSQNLFTTEHLEHDLQLTFYQLAVETTLKMPVKKLTLYHLRSNTPCTCEARKPEKLAEARQLILDVADGISQGIFPATENSLCSYCDFPQHCPYQKHKYAQEEPNAPITQALDGKTANEVVEQYAALQNQKKTLENQIEGLKEMICRYCESQGYNRLYGRDHTVSYKKMERTGFAEDKVKAILENTGLWPRVLKFDPALVKALLEADYLNPELRKKLAALKEITSSYPMLSLKRIKGNTEDDKVD
jgi:putative RecB family exonuclease